MLVFTVILQAFILYGPSPDPKVILIPQELGQRLDPDLRAVYLS